MLLSYYQAQQNATPQAVAAANTVNSATGAGNSATAKDVLPWNRPIPKSNAETAKILSTTDFLSTTNVPLSGGATSDTKLEQDNQKLFSVYSAIGSLNYLAQLAQSSTETSGQLAGLNTRFQTGLAQVQKYLSSTDFNNYNVQMATPASSVTSTAAVPLTNSSYSTKHFIPNANLNNPVPGLSASSSFTIAVTKGGATTNVAIDLSQVQGPLTLGNIVSYVNSQLSTDGFSTRFQKTQAGGTPTDESGATYGLQILQGANEKISLSAASTPALYLVGDTGSANEVDTTTGSGSGAHVTTTPANESGRLTKITNLGNSTPSVVGSSTQQASTGVTTAQATVTDASGNIYVVGNATGNFGNQLNQGSQDVYLTKYDSAGNQVWSKLVGSAGSAAGYGVALDPAGGVVITGSTTANVTTTSITNGNTDSFVASYDANGNQNWIQQIQTLATNQANAVSVDASGNVYIGGSVSGGLIGAGQTSTGTPDAYLAEYNSKGKLISENQFGTSAGSSQVSATAIGSDGSLYAASIQNGDAVVSKYANGDINSAPVWTEDLGALQGGGAIGGMTISGNQIYVSGTTSNGNLTAGGQASIANASTGGTDAFVFNLTDGGASATPGFVSYVGTSASDQGGAVTVGSDGTIYLAGTTTGTLPGQQRTVPNTTNAFAAALNANGSIAWAQQFGGASGQSTGAAVAVAPQGASVLDALGLPQGTIDLNESVNLTAQTTLRSGDSFQIKIEGQAPRTVTITVGANETLDSLIIKINGELGIGGKASLGFAHNAETLQIAANPGQTIDLISGPADSDVLSRLGIAAGALSAPAKTSKNGSSTPSTTSTSSTSSKTPQTYGLGLTGTMDISTKTGADLARSTLLTVMSSIQNIYQKSNAPPPTPTLGNTGGTASSQTGAQLASYNMALSLLSTSSGDAMNNIMAIVNGGTAGSASVANAGPSIAPLL